MIVIKNDEVYFAYNILGDTLNVYDEKVISPIMHKPILSISRKFQGIEGYFPAIKAIYAVNNREAVSFLNEIVDRYERSVYKAEKNYQIYLSMTV